MNVKLQRSEVEHRDMRQLKKDKDVLFNRPYLFMETHWDNVVAKM